jgi:hypothetical protein
MLYAPFTSPMRATCPAHLILLALITLTILGEEYKPCSFLQPLVTSSLEGPNILLSTLLYIWHTKLKWYELFIITVCFFHLFIPKSLKWGKERRGRKGKDGSTLPGLASAVSRGRAPTDIKFVLCYVCMCIKGRLVRSVKSFSFSDVT